MYDIRQFRPTLYLLLLLGLAGFCLAAGATGLFVAGGIAIGAHFALSRAGLLRPLPSWAAGVISLGIAAVIAQRFMVDAGMSLLIAGQFLTLLQLVKLYQEGWWERRGEFRLENRNYAWLLALSLLLMVAAAISTASLLFGVLLLAYLFLSLYCCLLFHLKCDTELIRAAMRLPRDVVSPSVLRQDERYLPSSMRRLTGLVAACGLVAAALVFVFFPRGAGQGMLGQLQLRQVQAMTGFTETVSFESVARITQSNAVAAYVEVIIDGRPDLGGSTLFLRGLALDTYTGDGQPPAAGEDGPIRQAGGREIEVAPWKWIRGRQQRQAVAPTVAPAEDTMRIGGRGQREIIQRIRLEPTGTNVLFAIAGPYQVSFGRDTRFVFSPYDESIRIAEVPALPIEYEVHSRGTVGFGSPLPRIQPRSRIHPRIAEHARRPEVSGVNERGESLAQLRGDAFGPHPLDRQIARNIEQYLRTQFSYTLDLTDTVRGPGQDPLVQFLVDFRRGHCEYFAGAMVLMCQSLGMDARMVTGFRAQEFNPMMGRYVVRQRDAHAWVEVRVSENEQWVTFDPTSAQDAGAPGRAETAWGHVLRFVDFLQYSWANAIVAYDRGRREALLTGVTRGLADTAEDISRQVRNWEQRLSNPGAWWISPRLVGGVIAVMLLIALAAIGYYLWERYAMRRRARRIGIEDLPDEQSIRLARQLGFYDDLLTALAARGYTRPAHFTPEEFSRTLTHLPSEAYDSVRRLTRIYYRIRYGRAELSPPYQARVDQAVARLEPMLGPIRP